VDSTGRSTRAGAEVRAFAAGTRRLITMRLVDTGSGYNAQNEMPVILGLPTSDAVDIEITWPGNGRRLISMIRDVRPGRALMARSGR
jgi:hypothetical protein